MKKDRYIQIIAIVLILAVFLGSVFWGLGDQPIEPDNPLLTQTDDLNIDVSQLSGSADMTNQDENQEIQEEPQENEEEQEEEEQKEEQEEEEQKEEQEEEEQKEEQEEKEQQEKDEENPDKEEEHQEEVEEREEQEENKDNSEVNEEGQEDENSDNKEDGKNTDDTSQNESEEGETPTDSGDENLDNPGTGNEGNENEPGLVTDLYNRIITFSELEDDTLRFYVYYSDPTVKADIKVNYRHKNDRGSGKYLYSYNNKNYETKLSLGTNYISVYYTDHKGERNYTRFVLTYQADKADENTPTMGEQPPIIKTNLDTWEGPVKITEFTFVVSARTWDNKVIHSNNLEVRLNGQVLKNPTGNGTYEYVLNFERPNVGDYNDYKVSVLAWDDEGNSRYVTYDIQYHAHDEGEALGAVTVEIDATTVGCGVVDECVIDIKSGDTAATAIVAALEECGYEYTNSGTIFTDFYLSSISRADAFRGCAIDARLMEFLERDGIGKMPDGTRDKIGEHDFTRGSGWLYFINGELCPGKALSAWRLNGGETISLRYTLAFGKDMGLSSYDMGTYATYCCAWVRGEIIELGHNFGEEKRKEPTENEDGYVERACSKCGELEREILPAIGNKETEEPKPTPTPELTPTPEPTPEPTPNPTLEPTSKTENEGESDDE